ncbi:MAG: peptidylprolyl isomerase [Planctomycetota bacterium]
MKTHFALTVAVLACLSLAAPMFAQDSKPTSRGTSKPTSQKAKTPKHINPVVLIKTSLGDIELELFELQAPKTVANFIALAEGSKEFTDAKTRQKVKRPFYDGLNFHRCMSNFMAQGGCPLGNGGGDPGYSFEDEINATSFGYHKEKMMVNDRPHQIMGRVNPSTWQSKIMQPIFDSLNIKNQTDLDAKRTEVKDKIAAMTLLEGLECMGYRYNDKLPASTKPKKGTIAMANSGPNTNGSQFFISVVDNDYLAGKHTVFGKVTKGYKLVEKIVELGDSNKTSPPQLTKIISIRLLKAASKKK